MVGRSRRRRRAWRVVAAFALAAVLGASGCERPAAPAMTVDVPARTPPPTPSAAAAAGEQIDLSITFDPRVTGNDGWVKLPKPLSLDLMGNPGAAILESTATRPPFPHGDAMRLTWLRTMLARSALVDTSLVLDEESLCSAPLLAAVEATRPVRLLIAVEGGITSRVVGCLAALPTARLYLTGCLYRGEGRAPCDGDTELGALASDETVRARVRGLAVSLSRRDAVERLGRFPDLEYLALSPGRGPRDDALFDALPYAELGAVRYLEASAENLDGEAFDREALRFLGRLHTLRWNGHVSGAIPAPCRLTRASFDVLRTQDMEALAACTKLRELSSDDAQLESAEAVSRLPELERLHLRHLKAESFAPLARLGNLRFLGLPAGRAKDFGFVASMVNLRAVDLSQTPLRDLTPMRDLAQLEELDVDFTDVSDLTPLRALTRLSGLRLHETKVVDLSVVAQLPALKELSFSKTGVTDLRPLTAHPSLEWVTLYETGVTDASALLTLPKLRRANVQRVTLPKEQKDKLRQRLHGDLYE